MSNAKRLMPVKVNQTALHPRNNHKITTTTKITKIFNKKRRISKFGDRAKNYPKLNREIRTEKYKGVEIESVLYVYLADNKYGNKKKQRSNMHVCWCAHMCMYV